MLSSSTGRCPGDVAAVEVVRVANAAAGTLVFRGRDDEFVDRKLRNGARYRYELTAIDQAGNRSRASVSAVPTASPLLEPARGARLTAPPALVWEPVKRASYYNVQLFRGKRKVLSAWPAAATLQLGRSWRYGGSAARWRPAATAGSSGPASASAPSAATASSSARAASASRAERRPPPYSGMLPCLRLGVSTRLVCSVSSARISRGRVSCGTITSSM